MDRGDGPSAAICRLCGEVFKLPEDDTDGNLPRLLLCGHTYCTSCLQSIQRDSVIRCPDCEIESVLPEGGVCVLQEDSRIIGLIYTDKMNKLKRQKSRKKTNMSTFIDVNANVEEKPVDIGKIEKVVDEALAQAAQTLAQLEHVHETLTTGVKTERARLELEIRQATEKAVQAIEKWKDVQLKNLEPQVSIGQASVRHLQERIKALQIAMQMAKEIRRVPFLEEYCILDKILETLQAPLDKQFLDMKFIPVASGISCVFHSEALNQGLTLSLKMEEGESKRLSVPLLKNYPQTKKSSRYPPGRNKQPQKHDQESLRVDRASFRGSSLSPTPRPRVNLSQRRPSSDGGPDVMIEQVIDEGQEDALPPTGPEMASDKWRIHRKRKNHQVFVNKRNVVQWVVVTHVVNPSHFYVNYLAEKRESEILSKKINSLCCGENLFFGSSDTVEAGSVVFVRWKEGLWCRASVVEVVQSGCVGAVDACPVTRLSSLQVFFLDHGLIKTVVIGSEDGNTESTLTSVNNHLKKVGPALSSELSVFAPQAVRCALKDLVPYDLIKGWSTEAQVEFCKIVGSAAVEMRPLGQDRDSLLVDLRKAPMNQSSDVPISVREYLVFIEVARFYSPVIVGNRPLLYYPPVYPKTNTQLDAVVSHINDPSDFYIQLVDNMESLLLSAKLQDCYNASTVFGEDELSIYCPVNGQACVARFEDTLWYRAQVVGLPGRNKAEVRYVDFGNKKILSVSDLRKIKDEFFALPSMAIHCCLSDVIPVDGNTWSDACIKRFISLVHQKLISIIAKGPRTEPLPVKVFEGDLNGPLVDIAELLVQEELACFTHGPKSNKDVSTGKESTVWDPPLELDSDGADSPAQLLSVDKSEDLQEFQPQLKLPAELKDLKVRVSHINSPSSFYVQFTQYDSQLKRICELVKQECALVEPQEVTLKADTYCAAHINGVWERGQICSDVTSNNIAEVRRCDHGNTVKLHVSNLRPLPPSLMGSLALECSLNDIRPTGGRSTWTNTACDLITYYLKGASAVMNIKEFTDERPVPVTLFCSNRNGQLISIADFLVSEGLALKERKTRDAVVQQPKETDAVIEIKPDVKSKTDPSAAVVSSSSSVVPTTTTTSSTSINAAAASKPTHHRTILTAEKVKTPLYRPPELPCPGHIQTRVTAIGEDGLIYARTQNAEYELEQLKQRIQQSLRTWPTLKPYTWRSVQGCAIIGADTLWYRGQLLEVQGGNITVQYVDYGLVENIPMVHVYPTLLCDDVPQLCMPCQLLGIKPIGGKWQSDAVALLRELLLNRSVDMQVVELPADPREPLTVHIFLDGLSLNEILCHHEHVSVDQTPSEQKGPSVMSSARILDDWDFSTEGLEAPLEPMLGPFVNPKLPKEGEEFPVRVKHLRTPNELFLWPLETPGQDQDQDQDQEVDGETLDEALTRINESIDSLPPLNSFPCGGPCLAEYSDGRYYRARMLHFTTVDPVKILVQHVDFGSDDTLPTSKLRQIPAKLLKFPTQVLKVKVAGFKAPSVNKQEDVLPYSPEWSVKAAMDMVDLLHNNITASVVALDPELKVLLYDEDRNLVHLPLVSSGLAEVD